MKKLYFLTLYLVLIVQIIAAQTTAGPNFPTAYATSGNGSGWGNLIGVQFVDNSPAYADLAQFPTCNSFLCYYSDVAEFTGFGFSIPTGATVLGIQVDMLQRVNSPGGGIHDSLLVLTLNGVQTGNIYLNPNNWYDTPTVYTYGGATDMWGSAWSPADINDPTFGLLFRITNSSYDQTASVDHLTMTVYYQGINGLGSQTASPVSIFFSDKKLIVSGGNPLSWENAYLQVTDMGGAIVYEGRVLHGMQGTSIDATSWRAGVYTVEVIINQNPSIRKKIMLTGG
jgi:hypothetical protein